VPTRYLRAQAPDFPVEGLLLRGQMHNLRYHGHGTLLLQSRLTLEIDHAHRRGRVVVTGLPWPLRVPEVLERLRQLELEGVTAVHDESTVDTPKLLIELEHAAFGWEVQRAITASGVVTMKFEARMRVSADAAPRTVTVDEVLQVFIADQLAVERRKVEAENRRLQQRVANAEAVVVARVLDQPILAALRHTDDDEQAVPLLMNLMTPPLRAQLESLGELSHDWARGFTEPQARHVLSVRKLWSKQRATAFREWEALKDELSSATIDEAQLRRAVIEKLERARERFGSPRRTIPH
jgi:DNA gyrase/topoisomerase IV subunit A